MRVGQKLNQFDRGALTFLQHVWDTNPPCTCGREAYDPSNPCCTAMAVYESARSWFEGRGLRMDALDFMTRDTMQSRFAEHSE